MSGYAVFTPNQIGEIHGRARTTGSDVSAGTYRCTNCGETIDVGSVQSLPPCPNCANNSLEPIRGTARTTLPHD